MNVRLDRGAYGSSLLRGESAGNHRRGGKDNRRAHQYQSQQGRAYRAPAQRHPGRYLRPHAARRRPQRRSAELYRQHRRSGSGRGGRRSSNCTGSRPPKFESSLSPAASTISAGISTPPCRNSTTNIPRRCNGASDSARYRSGRRRTAENGAPGSPIKSSQRIWRPCIASTSNTTSCRARARSCI